MLFDGLFVKTITGLTLIVCDLIQVVFKEVRLTRPSRHGMADDGREV